MTKWEDDRHDTLSPLPILKNIAHNPILWQPQIDENTIDPSLLMLDKDNGKHKMELKSSRPTINSEEDRKLQSSIIHSSDFRQRQGWRASPSFEAIHPSELNETSSYIDDPEISSCFDFGYGQKSNEKTNGVPPSTYLSYFQTQSRLSKSSSLDGATWSNSRNGNASNMDSAWGINDVRTLESCTSSSYNYPSPVTTLGAYRSVSPATSFPDSTYSLFSADTCLPSQTFRAPSITFDSDSQVANPDSNSDEMEDARRRREEDAFIVAMRKQGMKFKDIIKLGGFTLAESTIRGRYRMLTKPKHERVRKPIWRKKDDELLLLAVERLSSADRIAQVRNRMNMKILGISWDAVKFWIRDHGGSYGFASAACKKRWMALSHIK
jgi:hypothetical protein